MGATPQRRKLARGSCGWQQPAKSDAECSSYRRSRWSQRRCVLLGKRSRGCDLATATQSVDDLRSHAERGNEDSNYQTGFYFAYATLFGLIYFWPSFSLTVPVTVP